MSAFSCRLGYWAMLQHLLGRRKVNYRAKTSYDKFYRVAFVCFYKFEAFHSLSNVTYSHSTHRWTNLSPACKLPPIHCGVVCCFYNKGTVQNRLNTCFSSFCTQCFFTLQYISFDYNSIAIHGGCDINLRWRKVVDVFVENKERKISAAQFLSDFNFFIFSSQFCLLVFLLVCNSQQMVGYTFDKEQNWRGS